MTPSAPTIYSIGHGLHAFAHFLELLREHEIEFVCDVRSVARSRWPQYNGRVLEKLLRENGIGYEHLPECGGKVIAPPEELARGLDRVVELASEMRVAVMTAPGSTAHTRRYWVARATTRVNPKTQASVDAWLAGAR